MLLEAMVDKGIDLEIEEMGAEMKADQRGDGEPEVLVAWALRTAVSVGQASFLHIREWLTATLFFVQETTELLATRVSFSLQTQSIQIFFLREVGCTCACTLCRCVGINKQDARPSHHIL